MNGALLIHKPQGISSFGVIENLQHQLLEHPSQRFKKRKELPKLGHGGTLDPFASGVLVVLVGRAVKLARYFLGATKTYEGVIRFGETTVPGDPTAPISEKSDIIPNDIEPLRDLAHRLTLQPYLQTPPMHSAKKKNGRPLYELARQGLEVEREPKLCHLYDFQVTEYITPRMKFTLSCSSGTYVRTLAQDFGRLLGSVALLESLCRIQSGIFPLRNTWTPNQISETCSNGKTWQELPCWVPFDHLLAGYDRAEATLEEQNALYQGKQNVLFNIIKRIHSPPSYSTEKRDCLAIYCKNTLIAVARKEQSTWGIERVFAN
jgi:tRNA pseudouridine55 synthase